MKFQQMVKKSPTRHEMGIVICDKAKHEAIIQPRVGLWIADGTRLGKLTRIVEVPLFVDSAASRLIQLADLIAHAVWRAYEKNDADMLDLLLPAFIRGQGDRLDSFSHLSGRHSQCDCHPCISRRPRPLPDLPVQPETQAGYLQSTLFSTNDL